MMPGWGTPTQPTRGADGRGTTVAPRRMMTPMRPTLAIALAISIAAATLASAGVDVAFLYRLSNFSGVLPYSDVQIHADRYHDEVYVGEGDVIRVFNAAGMEIFEFTHDASKFGSILDIATNENGEIFVLSYCSGSPPRESGPLITLYNYRGEPKRSFGFDGLPEAMSSFAPNRMLYRNKKLVFASTSTLMVLVTDAAGTYESQIDLVGGLEIAERARDGAELGGFDMDASGAILYTIPTAFKAFRRKPDGTAEAWGKSGSSPGNFGIAGSITEDEAGDIVVADRARGVVLVFTPNLLFLREFGSRGPRDEQLVGPGRLAMGSGDKLYVTQLALRGIAVFSLTAH